MKANTLLLALVLSLGLAACGEDKATESAAPADTAAPAAPMETAPVSPASTEIVADAGPSIDAASLYKAKCASCHGATGEGLAGNPKLAGLTRTDIESRLKDYRDGKQMGPKTAIMATMAKPLGDGEIAALAGYLGE